MTQGSQTSSDQVLVECSSLFRLPAIPELIELINTMVLPVKPTKRPKGVCEPTCLAPRRGHSYKLFTELLTLRRQMGAIFQLQCALLAGIPRPCLASSAKT